MTTIASKLFRVSKGSAVYELVDSLEQGAKANGLALSRWQSNKGGNATTVSYALHTGERAGQYRYQPEDSIVASVVMNQAEGTTERCEAYRELRKLEIALDSHMAQMSHG